jgi:hypothetical protein
VPQEIIDFSPKQDTSSEELGGASPYALNVIADGNGVISKRPGIATYSVAPSTVVDADGIIGLYATNDSQLFAIGGTSNARKIYKVAGGSANNISSNPNNKLNGLKRPTFTETEVFLVLTGGQNIQKVKLSDLTSSRLAGDPPLASHVIANSSRLLANDILVDKTKVRYSGISQGTVDTSGHETWGVGNDDDGGFFTAEARPDNVVAIHENTNEIFVWGSDNVQVFAPDTNLIFAPIATKEFGCLAPYSIIKKDGEFFWLDQHRRIVYSDGRQFNNIDKPIKKQLDALSNPTDCFGFRVLLGDTECFCWSFVTDQVTFVYQVDSGWGIWNSWDSAQSNFGRLNILSHHIRRDGGVNVVGTHDGKIGKLDLDTPSDLGGIINSQVATGFLDRGTDNRKFCRSVKISARRGSTSTNSVGRLEWRDNASAAWQGPFFVDFGETGDHSIVKEIRSLGVYSRRQWRFTFSDSANLSLVRVVEDFEQLGI